MLNTTGFLIIHVAADGSVTGTGMGTGTVDQSGSPCVGKGRIGYNFTAVGGYIAFVGNFSIAFPSVLPQTFIWSVSCNGYPPSPANYGNPFPVPAGLAMQLRDGAVSSGGWTYTDNSGGGTYKYRWSLNACPGGLCPAA